MQLEPFKNYPHYQALAVLRYGELIGDFLSLCDEWAKNRPNTVDGMCGLKIKSIVELSTIENPDTDCFYSPKIRLDY